MTRQTGKRIKSPIKKTTRKSRSIKKKPYIPVTNPIPVVLGPEKNGIQISMIKTIKRLSGPNTMYYVTNIQKPELPLVLLFGDYHGVNELCKDPDADVIYDRRLLQEMDKIAKHYPIDFFVEMGQFGKLETFKKEHFSEKGDEQILFKKFIHDTVLDCLGQSNRRIESSCPTRYIRWHNGDTRFAYHSVETCIHFLDLYLQVFNKGIPIRQSIDIMIMYGSDMNIFKLSTLFANQIIDEIFITEKSSATNRINGLVDYVVDTLYEYETPKQEIYSYIVKQLNKLPSSIRITREEIKSSWKEIIHSNFNVISYEYDRFIEKLSVFSEKEMVIIKEIIKKGYTTYQTIIELFNYYHVPENVQLTIQGIITDLRSLLLNLFSPLLDFYTVFRMLKIPEKNDRSIVTFGYFGDAHCRNISTILYRVFGYVIEFVYENEDLYNTFQKGLYTPDPELERNCITINHPILLYDDIIEQASKRYKDPVANERLQQYLRNISKESSLYEESLKMNKL